MATQTAQNPVREKLIKGLNFQKTGEIEGTALLQQVLKKRLPMRTP